MEDKRSLGGRLQDFKIQARFIARYYIIDQCESAYRSSFIQI